MVAHLMGVLCLAVNPRFRGSLQGSRPRAVLKAQIMDVCTDPISLDQNSHFEGQEEGITLVERTL